MCKRSYSKSSFSQSIPSLLSHRQYSGNSGCAVQFVVSWAQSRYLASMGCCARAVPALSAQRVRNTSRRWVCLPDFAPNSTAHQISDCALRLSSDLTPRFPLWWTVNGTRHTAIVTGVALVTEDRHLSKSLLITWSYWFLVWARNVPRRQNKNNRVPALHAWTPNDKTCFSQVFQCYNKEFS